jgi:hypothetical protein
MPTVPDSVPGLLLRVLAGSSCFVQTAADCIKGASKQASKASTEALLSLAGFAACYSYQPVAQCKVELSRCCAGQFFCSRSVNQSVSLPCLFRF